MKIEMKWNGIEAFALNDNCKNGRGLDAKK